MNEKQKKELDIFCEKTEKIYKVLKWTWYDSKIPPDKKRIKKVLLELIKDLKKNGDYISTGGLFAERVRDEDFKYLSYGFKFEQDIYDN